MTECCYFSEVELGHWFLDYCEVHQDYLPTSLFTDESTFIYSGACNIPIQLFLYAFNNMHLCEPTCNLLMCGCSDDLPSMFTLALPNRTAYNGETTGRGKTTYLPAGRVTIFDVVYSN